MIEFERQFKKFDRSANVQLRSMLEHQYSNREEFYSIVKEYVKGKFMLEEHEFPGEDLIGLAKSSLSKMQRIDPAILRRINASGCLQSTAVIDKKTSLISTLEEKLNVKINMRIYPSVKTLSDFSNVLYDLLHPARNTALCIPEESGSNIIDCKRMFPLLSNKHTLVYLDNAATTQKPSTVIQRINDLYCGSNANVHRCNYALGQEMTQLYEEARMAVQSFINARSKDEIVFASGATDAINMLSFSFGEAYIHPGDEIIVSQMEHHSNFVPWQALCKRKGAVLKVLPILPNGMLNIDMLPSLLGSRTKLLAVTHVSNAIGTVNPIKDIIDMCKANHTAVMIDASQSVPHIKVDVQALDCDFLAFSGHKMYGPTGIGVLYAKRKWLAELPPYRTGGGMINRVSADETTFHVPPYRFEAGTANYIGAVSLQEAIRFLQDVGMNAIAAHEKRLLSYALERLSQIDAVHIIGNPNDRIGVVSFFADGITDDALGKGLDNLGIAVRVGAHCAQPLLRVFSRESSLRVSIGVYNSIRDVDLLCDGIQRCIGG